MKKISKFQKRIIAISCLALVAVACVAVYFIRGGDEDEVKQPTYAFTAQELDAITAFDGKATFSFKADKGKADDFVAAYMRLADGYASVNGRINVKYGTGDKDCVLSVNGKELVPDKKALFKTLEDGTPYATDARAYFNKALFGGDLGAVMDALSGFDLDGDRVNSAGYAYVYGPIERKNIKYIYVKNEFDELTLVPLDGSFYLADTDMDLATSVSATLVAAARAPASIGKVENPAALSEYGLDSDENATAVILIQDTDDNAYYMRVGKRLTDGSGFYAWCHGKDLVYILPASISNYILIPKEKFLVANYGTALSELTDVFKKVNEISINIGDDLIKAEFMSDSDKENHPINYTWKVTAPSRFVVDTYGYALPNYGTFGDVFNALCALATDEVVEADVNEESLNKYGLAEPYRSYSWLYDGETRCTVHFSKPNDDGDYYVYSVKETVKTGEKKTIGIGLIKGADASYVGYEVMDYLDNQLYTQYFDKLDGMEFIRNGQSYKITLGKNSEGAVETARINGEELDLLSCKTFFRYLLQSGVLGEYDGGEEKPQELFNLKVTSNGKTTEFGFGRVSSMKAYVIVDGKTEYTMDYALLETLIGGADKLIAGEKFQW